jgi:hypothetical protein
MLADPNGSGVWLLASYSAGTSLMHWTAATGRLTAFPADSPGQASTNPMAFGAPNRLWIGGNTELSEVNTTTGVTRTIRLPAVGSSDTSPVASSSAAIVSIALGAHGSIVVARAFASALQMVDPITIAVHTIPLPSGTMIPGLSAPQLAIGPGGQDLALDLYAGHSIYELGQLDAGRWSLLDTPCEGFSVSFTGRQLSALGTSCAMTGALTRPDTPAALKTLPTAGLVFPSGAVALGDGTVVVLSRSGVVGVSDGASEVVSLGTMGTGPPAIWRWSTELPTARGLHVEEGGARHRRARLVGRCGADVVHAPGRSPDRTPHQTVSVPIARRID